MMGTKASQARLYYELSLDRLVPANHPLRRLAAAVDFGFVRSLVRRYYSHTGKPSVDPVVLFKLWLLGYLYNITSERRLCEEASMHAAYRWFLGYDFDEAIPDHSVLTKARRRFGVKVYEDFFRRVVRLCEERGLIQGEVLFVDSTLVRANAAERSLLPRSLGEHRIREPAQYVADLWAVNDELEESEPDERGRRAKPRKSRRRENVDQVCVTDPDAELSKTIKRERFVLSHKAHLGVDGGRAGIITAAEVRASTEPDGWALGGLLDRHQATLGRPLQTVVGDQGYGIQRGVLASLSRGVTPNLRLREQDPHRPGFERSRFEYDAARDVYRCPAKQELRPHRQRPDRRATEYRADPKLCRSCPLKQQCCPGVKARTLNRSWHIQTLDAIRARQALPEFAQLLKRRQVVSERAFAVAKQRHGLERAQFRRRPSVKIQVLLTAAAMNLVKLAQRTREAQGGMAVALLHVRTDLPIWRLRLAPI